MSDSIRWLNDRPVLTWVRAAGVVVILSFALSGYTFVQQSRVQAERAADKKAANTTQVARCYQQIRDAPAVLRILDLVDVLASNSIDANRQALEISPLDDPLRAVRKDSLRRLVPARRDLRRFVARSKASVPDKQECDQLAQALDVDTSKLGKR